MAKLLLSTALVGLSLNAQNVITTVAGTGTAGFASNGTSAVAANLNAPTAIVATADGQVFFCDTGNSAVLKIVGGTITIVAGNGTAGFSGDGGPATAAMLNRPSGLAYDDTDGTLYIADTANQRIRVVKPNGTISTFAGTGTAGFSGDNGPATAAQVNAPNGLVLEATDSTADNFTTVGTPHLFIVDSGNSRIRVIDLKTGIISTLAGSSSTGAADGIPGSFNIPVGVAHNPGANLLYVSDTNNNKIRAIDLSSGAVSTVAGSGAAGFSGDGGKASSAALNSPRNIVLDPNLNLYIADFGNQRVRVIDANGNISTVAGNGVAGFAGDNGPAAAAQLSSPRAAARAAGSYLYITDTSNNRVRLVKPPAGPVSVSPTQLSLVTNVGATSPAQTFTVSNTGTSTLTMGSITASPVTAITINYGSCSLALVQPGSSCNFSLTFSPPAAGTYQSTITVTNSAGPLTIPVTLTGVAQGFAVGPTSLTFNTIFGAASPTSQTVTVSGTGWSGAVATTSGGPWLSITPTSSTTAGSLSVAVNSTTLLGGQTYLGTVTVTPTGGGTPVVVNVTLNVAFPQISVTPKTLSFTQVEGQVAQGASVMLGATPAQSNWSTTVTVANSTIQWLSVTPTGGSFPQSPTIFPNALAANLTAAGSPYTGTVTFNDGSGSPSTLTVQVTLTVTAPPPPTLTVSQTSVQVTGSQTKGPSPVTILIGNSGSGSLNFSVTQLGAFVSSASSGAPAMSVAVPTASATLHQPVPMVVSFANPSTLYPTDYFGTLIVTAGTQSITIGVYYGVISSVQLAIGTPALRFSVGSGGVAPGPQTVLLANVGTADLIYSIGFRQTYGHFLAAPPQGTAILPAGASSTFQLQLNPILTFQPGTFYDDVIVYYSGFSGANKVVGEQLLTVFLTVQDGTALPYVTAYPNAVILTPGQLSQTVTVSTTSATAVPFTITPFGAHGSITATASSASLNPTTTITITGSVPSASGIYPGGITLNLGNGLPSLDIWITLVAPFTSEATPQSRRDAAAAACTPKQTILALRQLANNFTATVGLPQNIEAQLVDDCANPVNGATVLASFSTGDAAVPLTNVGGGLYAATWNPGTANPVTVTITAINSTLPIVSTVIPGTVEANPTPPPQVSAAGVVNGASFGQNGVVSPGEIISVFGSTLATAPTPNSGFPLPTTLAGIKLSMGDVDLPLFFSSTGQVNAQVPTTLPPGVPTSLVARAFSGTTETADSIPVTVVLAPNTPGIFIAAESGAPNQGAILNNPALQVVDAAHPATAGDVITIYCTGLGATNPTPATGAASTAAQTTSPVTVTFGTGAPVAVQYAGLTPGLVGLYQVNVAVPAGLTPGSAVPVVLNQNGITSNVATIAVK